MFGFIRKYLSIFSFKHLTSIKNYDILLKTEKKPMMKKSIFGKRHQRDPQAVKLRYGVRKEWALEGNRTQANACQ